MNRLSTMALAVAVGAATAGLCCQPTASANPAISGPATPVQGSLNHVVVLGSHLAWAVGTQLKGHGVESLVERWDGRRWRQVSVPDEPGHDAGFGWVDGSSPHDVWAVGSYSKGPRMLSYADHWDGKQWTKVAIPNVDQHRPPFLSLLQGLSVVSPTDAWASGQAGGRKPWVLHWDGTSWTRVPCPNFGGRWDTTVWGVAAFSSSDAWIVGDVGTASGSGRTFAAHWDGTTWTRAETPNIPHKSNAPWSVGASSPDNVWAAGYAINPRTGHQVPLAMRWDGHAWTLSHLPPAGKAGSFWDIDTSSAHDAWAVGDSLSGALAMHWDGSSWTVESPPAPAASIVGVSDYSQNLAIAVGSNADGSVLHTVWDGSAWH